MDQKTTITDIDIPFSSIIRPMIMIDIAEVGTITTIVVGGLVRP